MTCSCELGRPALYPGQLRVSAAPPHQLDMRLLPPWTPAESGGSSVVLTEVRHSAIAIDVWAVHGLVREVLS